MSRLFLCWKAPETALSVHAERHRAGSCQGPPPVAQPAKPEPSTKAAELLSYKPMAWGTSSSRSAPWLCSYLGWQEKVLCGLSRSLSSKSLTLDLS